MAKETAAYKLGFQVGKEFAKELAIAEKRRRYNYVPMRTKNPHKDGTAEYTEYQDGFRAGMKCKE